MCCLHAQGDEGRCSTVGSSGEGDALGVCLSVPRSLLKDSSFHGAWELACGLESAVPLGELVDLQSLNPHLWGKPTTQAPLWPLALLEL